MNASEAVARVLDRANVKAADLRLRGTPSIRVAPACEPSGTPRLRARAGRREIWGADVGDWVAERRPAATRGQSPAALILLHGWLASTLQFAYYRWLARPLLDRMDIWMPRLPEHGDRTTRGAVSGELCLSGDAELTFAQIRCAVAETRWLARGLRERGHRVAIWGVSLGGWVAALAVGADVCDALVLWAPVLDPKVALRESALGSALAGRVDSGESLVALERRFEELSPTRAPWSIGGDRVLVVGGEFDDIAPPSVLRRASEITGARVRLLPHGHISLLASRRARRETLDFLEHEIHVRPHS